MDSGYVSDGERKNFLKNCKEDPVYFAENLLNDEYGELFILEDYQKQYLRCPANKKLLFWGRRLSKSLMIKIEAIHKSLFTRAHRTLVASPTMEQAIYFGEDIQDMLDASPLIDSMFVSKKSTKFKLKNNSRMYMATAGRGGSSQLGKNAHFLAFDETQIIPEETFISLRPTLRGQQREKTLVYAGTPLGKINEFYRAYINSKFFIKMGEAYKGEGGPRDFIAFEQPTAVIDDKKEPISSTTRRITLEELQDDYRDMPLTGFLREYCLEWMDSIGEVFSKDLLDRAFRWNDSKEWTSNEKVVMGLDLGKQRNASVLTIGELTGSGVKTINVIEWDLGTQYHEIADDIWELQSDYPNALTLCVDETGVGKGVIEIFDNEVDKKWKGLDILGFDFSGAKKKKELVEAGVTELEKGLSTLVYDAKLYTEMLEFKREVTPQNNIVYRKAVGGSDDFVDSLLLCLYAGRDYYGYVEQEEYIEDTGFSILNRKPVGRSVI